MDRPILTQVEADAARSLTYWTAEFADSVRKQAKQLAVQSGQPHLITASHYREAALSALQSLSRIIADEVDCDDKPKAA